MRPDHGRDAWDLGAYERGHALRAAAEQRSSGWIDACVDAALEDPHPFVRAVGARALNAAPDEDVVPRLAAVLAAREAGGSEPDADPFPPASRWRAERLLIRRDPVAVLAVLRRELDCDDGPRRNRAAEALSRLGSTGLDALAELADASDPGLRRRAAKGLGMSGQSTVFLPLRALLHDDDHTVRLAAVRALARLVDRPELEADRPDWVVESVETLLTDAEPDLRRAALLLAAKLPAFRIRSKATLGGLLKSAMARDEDLAGRVALLEILASGGAIEPIRNLVTNIQQANPQAPAFLSAAAFAVAQGEREVDRLVELLGHAEPSVRLAAVRALGKRPRDAAARSALEQAADDSDAGVRWLAARGLAGRLDERVAALQRARLPSEAASATWPFGLPEPDENTERRRRLPLAIATVNLSYNLNLGVLIRSAEAAGAREVLVVGRDFFHRMAAMGADSWVDVKFFETSGAMAAYARGEGYQLVAVQQSPGAERFDRADYPPRPCLLLGSEGPGLPPDLCALADLTVEIPQRGEIDSLNVATAAALVMWACLARRGWI